MYKRPRQQRQPRKAGRMRRLKKSTRFSQPMVMLALALALCSPMTWAQTPSVEGGARLTNPEIPQAGVPQAAEGEMDLGRVLSGILDPFEYDPRGRRDPFVQPIEDAPVAPGADHGPLLPLQKFELTQVRLIGIIWDVRRPKAMIKDPDGNTHIVSTYTKIGGRHGYIASIREGEIVVVETIEREGKLVSSTQVVKIAK